MAGSFWTDEELENWQRRVARLSPDAPAGLSREDALALFRELEQLRLAIPSGEPSSQGWVPSDTATDLARSVFFERLPQPPLEGLSNWLSAELGA